MAEQRKQSCAMAEINPLGLGMRPPLKLDSFVRVVTLKTMNTNPQDFWNLLHRELPNAPTPHDAEKIIDRWIINDHEFRAFQLVALKNAIYNGNKSVCVWMTVKYHITHDELLWCHNEVQKKIHVADVLERWNRRKKCKNAEVQSMDMKCYEELDNTSDDELDDTSNDELNDDEVD